MAPARAGPSYSQTEGTPHLEQVQVSDAGWFRRRCKGGGRGFKSNRRKLTHSYLLQVDLEPASYQGSMGLFVFHADAFCISSLTFDLHAGERAAEWGAVPKFARMRGYFSSRWGVMSPSGQLALTFEPSERVVGSAEASGGREGFWPDPHT